MRKSLAIVVLGLAALIAASWWIIDFRKGQENEGYAEAIAVGIDHFNVEEYQAAIEHLRAVPSSYSEAGRARYYEGSSLIRLKDYSAAIVPLEEGLQLDSQNTRIMHALGVAYFKLGNLAMSKAYFAQVLEIDPNDDEARGLMDIMANLERIQLGQPATDSPDEG